MGNFVERWGCLFVKSRSLDIGGVWLLLVCVVRCWVKFCNECNSCF